jgi:hypothetical protein
LERSREPRLVRAILGALFSAKAPPARLLSPPQRRGISLICDHAFFPEIVPWLMERGLPGTRERLAAWVNS